MITNRAVICVNRS